MKLTVHIYDTNISVVDGKPTINMKYHVKGDGKTINKVEKSIPFDSTVHWGELSRVLHNVARESEGI